MEQFNSEKKQIIMIYNKLQNSLVNYKELKYDNEYNLFEIYKIHVEFIEQLFYNNYLLILAIRVFRKLFESENNFNEFDKEKAEIINIFIDSTHSDNKLKSSISIDNKLIKILSKEKKEALRCLLKFLKRNASLDSNIYYLLIIILVLNKYEMKPFIDFLLKFLKQKYPYSEFDLWDGKTSFEKFIENLNLSIGKTSLENYMDIKMNKENCTLIISRKSIDEISNIIMSNDEKKNKKEKVNKNKNNENIQESKLKDSYKNEEENEKVIGKEFKEDQDNDIKNIDIKENEIKELNRTIASLKKEIKTLKEKNKEYFTSKNKAENENKKLNNIITQKNKKIFDLTENLMTIKKENADLKFNFKLIGLRKGYKTLIDLLLLIFEIEEKGNLKEKENAIVTLMSKYKNRKSRIIIDLAKDISNILSFSNEKAHYIDKDSNIIKELLLNLIKFTGKQCYYDLINMFKNIDVESTFNQLVIIRNQKINMKYSIFINKENEIIESIKKNPLIKDGEGLKRLIESKDEN